MLITSHGAYYLQLLKIVHVLVVRLLNVGRLLSTYDTRGIIYKWHVKAVSEGSYSVPLPPRRIGAAHIDRESVL